MRRIVRGLLCLLALPPVSVTPARAADANGSWASTFNTPFGTLNYIYAPKVEGATLIGTAKSENGESQLRDGKVEGDKISFIEPLDVGGMTILIKYSGQMTSDDEIKFARVIGDFGTDEIVAKRVK